MRRALPLVPAILVMVSLSASGQISGRSPDRADRFLATYDLNHDGRVSHEELNRVLAAQFQARARNGALSLEGFIALREASYRNALELGFRSSDWDGDGKLSFQEYAVPIHARFERFSPGGAESCTQSAARASFAKARFCRDYDLDHDGKVTRAELDQVTMRRFSAIAGKAKSVSEAQYVDDAMKRSAGRNADYFRRLDRDQNGSLSLAEYAASQEALFARLDRNKDGVLTREELVASSVYARSARSGASGG